MKISKLQSSKYVEGEFFTFEAVNFKGKIWYDGSGELVVKLSSHEIYYDDSGKLEHKLETLQETITELEENVVILKSVVKELSKLDLKKIFNGGK